LLAAGGWSGTVLHDASGDLFTIDLDGGMALEYVGTTDLEMYDMAFSPLGELYGVNNPWWGSSELYTFDVDFESSTPSVTTNFRGTITMGQGQGIYVNSAKFNGAGELLAAGADQSGENWLFKINPDTGGAQRVLALGVHQSAGDLAFDTFGNLYLTTKSGNLLRIPPGMDSYEVVGQTQYTDLFGLIYGPAPLMYGFREARGVYEIDPATGEATLVAQLTHPQLDYVNGAATVFPPPTNLGEVDFRELLNEEPVLGELWYRVEPTRDAVFTVDLANVAPGAEIELSLYEFDALGVLDQLPTQDLGDLRLDYEDTVPGAEYYVRIIGADANLDVRVANLVKPTGNGAVVYGTEENDTFTFAPGPPYTVMINGVNYPYNFSSTNIVTVTFDGGVGNDTADLTGSKKTDTATLNLASFSGSATSRSYYRVAVSNTAKISFRGAGGADSATLTGSGFANAVTLAPKSATVAGSNSWVQVTEVPTISVDAAGGADSATFNGTTGNETADLRYLGADFQGSGFSTSVANVETISAIAGGGYDTATFSDSPQQDAFEATPTWASLTGPGFSLWAGGFDQVRAEATPGGGDVATLRDDPAGKDRFEARPGYGRFVGAGFDNEAVSFRDVQGFSTAGNTDQAFLYGDPGETNTFEAWPQAAELSGAGGGYLNRTNSFRYVYAIGTPGGTDVAWLHGDPARDEKFEASPDRAFLQSSGHYCGAYSFRYVHADATPGSNDVAVLRGDPTQVDTFEAWPDRAELEGSGHSYYYEAKSFPYVYAFATAGGADEAWLHDDPAQDEKF